MRSSPMTSSVTSSSEAAKISARLFHWKEEEGDMKILSRVIGNSCLSDQRFHLNPKRWLSTVSHKQEPKEFEEYLDSLKNYEKWGVPKGAGTDSDDGFDLGRMERLLAALGNPHFKFKAVHIAGTKGKGSTAAFVANILRAQGYSVGCYTSPHILTVRERMTLGRFGKPVSANILDNLFYKIKPTLDDEILRENGALSHFEVLTAVAFTLFADEKTEIAVIEAGLGGARDATNVLRNSELAASIITTIGEEHLEALGGSLESIAMAKAGIIKYGCPVVLGGPFPLHIRKILFDKAESMSSPVVSVCDEEIKITTKGVHFFNGKPLQPCDIAVRLGSGFQESIQLSNVRLSMLGSHQLHNAVTAACTSLCLRHQGWTISDESIKTSLESTCLPGRSHFLSSKEAEALGITGTTVLLDGAHTKESAKALSGTIKETFPVAKLAFVIAMARDKDHVAFAKQLLSGNQAEAVFLTEAEIAGSKSRTTPSSLLRDCWLQASSELGKKALHDGMPEYDELFTNRFNSKVRSGDETILATENCPVVAMRRASKILEERKGSELSVLVVTGSLHVVSSVIASLNG